jgi:hypothetical protein
MLMTWTFDTPVAVGIVTAETCELACILLSRRGITVSNVDLVPVVTRSRWVRVLSLRPQAPQTCSPSPKE